MKGCQHDAVLGHKVLPQLLILAALCESYILYLPMYVTAGAFATMMGELGLSGIYGRSILVKSLCRKGHRLKRITFGQEYRNYNYVRKCTFMFACT